MVILDEQKLYCCKSAKQLSKMLRRLNFVMKTKENRTTSFKPKYNFTLHISLYRICKIFSSKFLSSMVDYCNCVVMRTKYKILLRRTLTLILHNIQYVRNFVRNNKIKFEIASCCMFLFCSHETDGIHVTVKINIL